MLQLVHHRGKPRHDLMQELEAETMEECCLLTCFPRLSLLAFLQNQPHRPRNGAAHSGLGPSTSIRNHENAPSDMTTS